MVKTKKLFLVTFALARSPDEQLPLCCAFVHGLRHSGRALSPPFDSPMIVIVPKTSIKRQLTKRWNEALAGYCFRYETEQPTPSHATSVVMNKNAAQSGSFSVAMGCARTLTTPQMREVRWSRVASVQTFTLWRNPRRVEEVIYRLIEASRNKGTFT